MRIFKVIILILVVSLYSCTEDKYKNLDDGIYADIQTSVGDILVKLEYKDVPMTVGNFVSLAEGTNTRVVDSMKGKPYYDGLKFHRVMSITNGDRDDFMIQGGCPLGNGTGDPGYKFADEFPQDSIGELLFKHNRAGVLSMANSGPASNGSQFFITIIPKPHLDRVHTIFGYVQEGQNIVDTKVRTDTDILKVDIIRVGKDAKNFNAFKAFDDEYKKEEEFRVNILAKKEEMKAEFLVKMKEYKSKAKELPSGLKIYMLKEGTGTKPGIGADIRVHYSVFFLDGKFLDTNRKEIAIAYGKYNSRRGEQNGYQPFPAKYSMKGDLIQGFKEGLLQMRFGDQAVLFVPSHLAYGDQASRGVPANSDLIFELEIYPKAE